MSKQAAAKISSAVRSSLVAMHTANSTAATVPHVCIQREAHGLGVADGAASLVRNVLDSPGQPLDGMTRGAMEQKFGYDFSGVRVHTDAQAAESARSVHANAYAAGPQLVFGGGRYEPSTSRGQALLAHELTHVVQQANGPVSARDAGNGLALSEPSDQHEVEARAVSNFVQSSAPNPFASAARRPLPGSGPANDGLTLQRGFLDSADWGGIGGIAGIAGGVFGLGSLVLAGVAYARPPRALNPAPPTGGIAFNPTPFQFNSLGNPVHEPAANEPQYRSTLSGPPTSRKILEVRTDGENHADINLATKTDSLNILDGIPEASNVQGYSGGSRGSTVTLNFSATQVYPAVAGLFDAPAAAPATAAPAANAPQTSAAAATGTAPASGGAAAAPATPTPAPAEMIIRFTGSNTKGEGLPQTFTGEASVRGDGTVNCTRCQSTSSSFPNVHTAGNIGVINYEAEAEPAAPGHGPLELLPEPSGRLDGQMPELPFNRPWTGASAE